MPYVYEGTVREVVDGDTVDLDLELARAFPFGAGHGVEGSASLDLGFHLALVMDASGARIVGRFRFRLMGYNAPESRGPERPLGVVATADLRARLPVGTRVVARTHKGDAFGRWLADLDVDGVDLVGELVRLGFGVPWDGKGGRPAFGDGQPYPSPVA